LHTPLNQRLRSFEHPLGVCQFSVGMLHTGKRLRQLLWTGSSLHLGPFSTQDIQLRCGAGYLSPQIIVGNPGNGLASVDVVPLLHQQLAQMSLHFWKYVNPGIGAHIPGSSDLLTDGALLHGDGVDRCGFFAWRLL
jgi:hypothetical protein